MIESGMRDLRSAQHGGVALLAAVMLLAAAPAGAGDFEFLGTQAKYSLTGSYAAAWRLQNPSSRNIDTPGRAEVPVADFLKYPESNNFDDGNRNFRKHALVNNRLSLLGEIEFSRNDFGLMLRGDAFYDEVYQSSRNDHDAPDRINTTQEPFNSFTDDARHFSGRRARLLDAYVYGTFYFGEEMALNVRLGRHIAAWGQSLFFSGVALAQAPADATRATVPGVDVKSILLPVNQLSLRFSVTNKLVLLGQYQFEFKPFELDPVGSYFSVSDLVGPGREFAYGLRNPLNMDNLAGFNLTDPNDISGLLMTINEALLDGALDLSGLEALLLSLPLDLLPPIYLPVDGINLLNAPEGLNPVYDGDIKPSSSHRQFGVGLQYALTPTTELGAYYLRYHQKTPAVVMNFGSLDIFPENELLPGISIPAITTEMLGLSVPESYKIRYFDNVDLYALSISTMLFGVNVGGEIIRREGVDVLVDVDNGVNGPVPTPTRATTHQVLLNGIYTFRPPFYFDALIAVGEVGWVHASDVQGQPSQEGANEGEYFDGLTFDREAWALSTLLMLEKFNVISGWDMTIPIFYSHAVKNRAPLNGAFGSLFGQDDIRLGVSVELRRLNQLTLGLHYSGFIGGKPHFLHRPYQDRDTIGISARYNFF
jgi:hypothetical protein